MIFNDLFCLVTNIIFEEVRSVVCKMTHFVNLFYFYCCHSFIEYSQIGIIYQASITHRQNEQHLKMGIPVVITWRLVFREHLVKSEGFFFFFWSSKPGGMGVLPASSGQRPSMLLNILPCTGLSPTTKNYPARRVNGVEVEKYCW